MLVLRGFSCCSVFSVRVLCKIFFHKFDLNETFNQSLTHLYLINYLTIYRANIAHQRKAIYELLKESKIFIKFSNYGLYSTPIAQYSIGLVLNKSIKIFILKYYHYS